MKYIYKKTKVVYDDHKKEYQVYYKNWFVWRYDTSYKFDDELTKHPIYYCSKDDAMKRAIRRAEGMLNTVEVWSGSTV